MNSNHQYGNIGKFLPNLSGNVDPVQVWHLEIQQDYIRRVFHDSFQRFATGSGFSAHSPRALQLQDAAEVMSNSRVIICYENTNHPALLFRSFANAFTAFSTLGLLLIGEQ